MTAHPNATPKDPLEIEHLFGINPSRELQLDVHEVSSNRFANGVCIGLMPLYTVWIDVCHITSI